MLPPKILTKPATVPLSTKAKKLALLLMFKNLAKLQKAVPLGQTLNLFKKINKAHSIKQKQQEL